MGKKPSLSVGKNYGSGKVAIKAEIKCQGYSSDSATISARMDIPLVEARAFAEALLSEIGKQEAKAEAIRLKEERRKLWRDREVAAGRGVVVNRRGK